MQGLTPLTAAPTTASGISAPGLSMQAPSISSAAGLSNPDLSRVTSDMPVSWLTPDMQSAIIDWSQFNPIDLPNYEQILNTAYKPKPKAPQPPPVYGMGAMGAMTGIAVGGNKKPVNPSAGDFFIEPPAPKTRATPVGFNMGMGGLQRSVGTGLPEILYDRSKQSYDEAMRKMSYVPTTALRFKDPKIDAAIQALKLNTRWGGSNLDEKNAAKRNQRFAEVSSSSGIPLEELQKYFNVYDKAYQTLADPVGANWQDIKGTGAFYTNQVLPAIRRYSGYDDAYFNKLAENASEGTRNSQKYLSPEYFALHTVSPNTQSWIGKPQGALIGNTNPLLSQKWWDDRYNNNPGVSMGKRVGLGWSDPYMLTNWQDYLDPTVSRMNVTPEQRAAAEAKYQDAKRLLSAKVEDGGQFNLWRETGTDPYKITKTKGGKWRPRNSAYTNELNIAQNYLPQATQGQKNYRDVGFDENTAYQSGFYFDKKKKKRGLFGGGLGSLLSLASIIPSPIQPFAMGASALNSLSTGDYFGALMSGLGAYGKFTGTNPLGAATDKLSGVIGGMGVSPATAGSIANALVQGGIGGVGAASRGGSFIKGALGGGLGAYTSGELGRLLGETGLDPRLAGAVSGATGSAINGAIQGGRGAPLAVNAALGGVSGYERGRAIKNKQNRTKTKVSRS